MSNRQNRLTTSLQEAIAYAKGDQTTGKVTKVQSLTPFLPPAKIDIKKIRDGLHLSQAEFAAKFGLNLNTLKNWEHGRREPDISTKTYLYAISKHPELIEQALYS